MSVLQVDDIRAAALRLQGQVVETPCLHSRTLSALCGCEVFLKFENHQFTASFKERGALNKLLSLDQAERARGVIAMSAGNHAQGVAFHAARLGVRAVIVMPRGTPNSKVRGTQVHGAEVVIEGDTLSDISSQYFGDQSRASDILAANPRLKSANHLKIGDVLTLPSDKGSTAPRPAPVATMRGTTAAPSPARTNPSTASISPPSTAKSGSKPSARHAATVSSRRS